jgi:hypothetical protein
VENKNCIIWLFLKLLFLPGPSSRQGNFLPLTSLLFQCLKCHSTWMTRYSLTSLLFIHEVTGYKSWPLCSFCHWSTRCTLPHFLRYQIQLFPNMSQLHSILET